MAASIVQSKTSAYCTDGSESLSFDSNVTAGNSVIVTVRQPGQASRTYTCSDGNAYSSDDTTLRLAHSTLVIIVQLFYYHNHAGGATTVTVQQNSAIDGFDFTMWEVSGLSNEAPAATDKLEDNDTANGNAPCSTGLTNANAGMAFAVVTSGYASTSYAAPTGWAKPTGDSVVHGASASKYFASGLSSETATFVQDGTARATVGVMALFKDAAAAPTFVPRIIMIS